MIPKIDLHQDLLLTWDPKQIVWDAEQRGLCDRNVWSYQDHLDAWLSLIVAAVFWHPWSEGLQKNICVGMHEQIEAYVDIYNQFIEKYDLWVVTSKHDLEQMLDWSNDKLSLLLHIEWIELCRSLHDLQMRYNKWVRSIWFVWNFDGWASACNLSTTWGLTSFWHECVEWMNQYGMLIDTAHMNHQAMMETVGASKKPILNSHSNLMHFFNHSRNVTDEFLHALAQNGGVQWLTVHSVFMSGKPDFATMETYLDQIAYVRKLIGDEHVALGTDYHGIEVTRLAKDMKCITDLLPLEERLLERFGGEFTEKFLRKNAMRVIESNLPQQ